MAAVTQQDAAPQTFTLTDLCDCLSRALGRPVAPVEVKAASWHRSIAVGFHSDGTLTVSRDAFGRFCAALR